MAETLFDTGFSWETFKNETDLDKKATHIFKIPTKLNNNQHFKEIAKTILSVEEMAKSLRFMRQEDCDRYLISRFSLRNILSRFIPTSPADINFHQYGNKKPAVSGIEFNLSHSNQYIVIAVSPTPIGIDIEYMKADFNFEVLSDMSFGLNEKAHINEENLPLLNFYAIWTRKEALLKASGEGLVDNLNEIDCLPEIVIRNGYQYQIKSATIEQEYMMSIACKKMGQHNSFYWNYSI
jgi:4'-phosphopantetheinyl transferase